MFSRFSPSMTAFEKGTWFSPCSKSSRSTYDTFTAAYLGALIDSISLHSLALLTQLLWLSLLLKRII